MFRKSPATSAKVAAAIEKEKNRRKVFDDLETDRVFNRMRAETEEAQRQGQYVDKTPLLGGEIPDNYGDWFIKKSPEEHKADLLALAEAREKLWADSQEKAIKIQQEREKQWLVARDAYNLYEKKLEQKKADKAVPSTLDKYKQILFPVPVTKDPVARIAYHQQVLDQTIADRENVTGRAQRLALSKKNIFF